MAAAMLVVVAACFSGGSSAASTPSRCTYHVSRTSDVPSVSGSAATYRAVITAAITDSAGHSVPSAVVARMPGGPNAYTDTQGRAVLHLSARDVERTDSTEIVVRRIAFMAIHVPVRVAAGDSIDITASMCPGTNFLSSASTSRPTGPEYDHSGVGTAIGAVVLGILGYRYELGLCDGVPSSCTGKHGAVGGALIGAVVGWGIGGVFTGHSACMAPDAYSTHMMGELRDLIDRSDSAGRAFRRRLGTSAMAPADIHVVTSDRVCQRARAAVDRLAHASNPSARGMKDIPSLYTIRAGDVIEVEIPGDGSASYFFDAGSWKCLATTIVPD